MLTFCWSPFAGRSWMIAYERSPFNGAPFAIALPSEGCAPHHRYAVSASVSGIWNTLRK